MPLVVFKVKVVSKEPGYLAEAISKQGIEDAAWFLLLLIVKWQERDKLRKELLSKKESELDNLENSQPIDCQ